MITKTMIDLKKVTPLILNMDTDGLFIPFSGMPLMQFTGLHDKNGKEIYEGDIVESVSPMVELGSGKPTGGIGIVRRTIEYRMEKGAFWARRLPDGRWETFGLTQERLTEYYTVVGNVHENPELLK